MKRKWIWLLALLFALSITIQPAFADDDDYEKKEKKVAEKLKKDSKYKEDDDDDDHDDDDYDDDDYEGSNYEFYYDSSVNNSTIFDTVTTSLKNVTFTFFDNDSLKVAVKSHNNELYVPINQLYSYLDLRLEWFGKEKILTLTREDHSIYLRANKLITYVDGKKQVLAYPPTVENGSIFVPLTLITSGFGLEVKQTGNQIDLNWSVKENGA